MDLNILGTMHKYLIILRVILGSENSIQYVCFIPTILREKWISLRVVYSLIHITILHRIEG